MDIHFYQRKLAKFAKDRNWEQFHSPKNLAMALAGEAGELIEIFQWATEKQSYSIHKTPRGHARVCEEIADITIYLLRLCDMLGIDIETAVINKLIINNKKYPIDLSNGNATKYNERDMRQIILQPAANNSARDHFEKTILNHAQIQRIAKFLTHEDIKELSDLYPDGSAPVWGVFPGSKHSNKTKWERIHSGDIAIFCRDTLMVASGTVTKTVHNKSAAIELWGADSTGTTWEYIYFLKDIACHNIPQKRINVAAGYKENYVIRGFNVLDDTKSAKIITDLNL